MNALLTTVSRNGVTCVAGCYTTGERYCDQTNRHFGINCDDITKVIVSVSPAVQNDFTTWSCNSQGNADSQALEQFGMYVYAA